jgi:L-glyceraldehyde 3-phosphate reductase
MLTDRYINGIPQDSRVRTDGRFLHEDQVEAQIERSKKLNDIAARRGQTLAEMALSWLLRDEDITSVIIGASKSSQILDNVKAIENLAFTDEELKEIDALSK